MHSLDSFHNYTFLVWPTTAKRDQYFAKNNFKGVGAVAQLTLCITKIIFIFVTII